MTRKLWMALVAVGLLAVPSVANAGLIGATVDVTFYFPDDTTLHCSNGATVVGAGVEYPASCDGFAPAAIDIADSQLVVNTGGFGWSGATFNGFLLSTLVGPDIVSAAYAGGTMGVTGLVVDNGNLWVNFAGQGGGIAYIDFETARVPEPATLALLGLGLAGFRATRRQKR